ncbi:hypothetical protein [Candidatus Finniella inopinata]|uniref:Uncharacterized protein n=1 Tax=Candidatus Finniella inopinata TaxID=1696036 RepID=A0A4Q7DJC0_9PROT|nr:hypothetical protein [Candidatus Finniella inopinata]RZI46440.1 hypothetical protein EQU50_02285 [Candidatus Finniella inopinata]
MLKFLSTLVTCALFTISLYAAELSLYLKPSFIEFEKLVLEIAQTKNNKIRDQNGKDHIDNITNILLTAFLQRNPTHIEKIIIQFNRYSQDVKLILANALVTIRGKDVLKELNYNFSSPKKALSIIDIDKISLVDFAKKGDFKPIPDNTDYLWAAFEGTGDDKYLINILTYLASEPLEIRTLAFEMINRDTIADILGKLTDEKDSPPDYKDIVECSNQLSKKDRSISLERLISCKVVLWSAMSQRNGNKDINTRILSIIKTNPKLDYSKDVKL